MAAAPLLTPSSPAPSDEELARISSAAMAAATREPTAPPDPFAPFSAFTWSDIDDPGHDPLGRDVHEARNVAWLMSCFSKSNSVDNDQATNALKYATRLEREVPLCDALYTRFSNNMNQLVHLDEVGGLLRCKINQVDMVVDGYAQKLDPYFRKMIDQSVRESVRDYLLRLDVQLSLLPGISESQSARCVTEKMEQVRNAVGYHLGNALLSREATPESIAATLRRLQKEFVPQHVADEKQLLRRQIQGVRALSILAAADDEKLEEALQELDENLIGLLSRLPCELKEQFNERRVSVQDLSQVFASHGEGFVERPTSVAPPSFAVRVSVLSAWLERSRDSVKEACVAAIATLQRLVDQPANARDWCEVLLCRTDHGDPHTRGATADRVVSWVPPAHLGVANQPRVLVASHRSRSEALRASRFFTVLLQQVQEGMLPALTVKAELLLPVLARVSAESEVGYSQVVSGVLRPLGNQCGHPWPDDLPQGTSSRGTRLLGVRKRLHSPTMDDACDAGPAGHTGIVPVGQAGPSGQQIVSTAAEAPSGTALALAPKPKPDVPQQLMRDHAILHALCVCMQPQKLLQRMRVSLDSLVSTIRGVAPLFGSQSDSSLRQAACWCCSKVLEHAHNQARSRGFTLTMEYSSQRDRAGDGKVSGVICEGQGVAFLCDYVAWCVNEMQYNGKHFMTSWRTSRSARCRAASSARRVAQRARSAQPEGS
jgi:hypothetical protein